MADPNLPRASARLGSRAILLTVGGGVFLVAAALGGTFFMVRGQGGQRATPPQDFPAPRLTAAPNAELPPLLAAQRARLAGIEDAMARVVARGAAAYEPAP